METKNEPEEGEIVDDYELIISDDEELELCMRNRIRELEAENEEIEQIAVISRSYDIERAARVPTDASSISSTEFKTPKKRKRHRNKDHKKKSSCHHHHTHRHHEHKKSNTRSRKLHCKRREKLLKKKHDKYVSHKDYSDRFVIDSPDTSLSSSSSSESDVSDEKDKNNEDYYHLRDTLRLAVGGTRHRRNSTRQTTHKNGLKERLLRKNEAFTGNLFSNNGIYDIDEEDDAVEIFEPEIDIHSVPDDSSDSMDEKELRLIALKSAVLKKHMERKRRNAEVAYSPTDFDELVLNGDRLVDIDVVDLDEDDSRNSPNNCGTASPIASPQLMLIDGQDDSSQMVDCKPIDMDIANSDSEDPHSNNWKLEMPKAMPFSTSFPSSDLSDGFSYGGMFTDFTTCALNPPPPGVDDYVDVKPSTLKFEKVFEIETQDMELENDDFETNVPYQEDNTQTLKTNSNTASLHSNPAEEDLQEEEEQALRALLLAKFQSPKNQKKSIVLEAKVECEEPTTNGMEESGIRTVKPIESILKEAVKRLQIHSQVKEEILPTTLAPQRLDETSKEECVTINAQNSNRQILLESEGSCSNDGSNHKWHHQKKENPNNAQFLKSDCDDLPMPALISLQRKAMELKNLGEHKDIESNCNTMQEVETKLEIRNERRASDVANDPVHNLDEDGKRRLQKLKEEILSATRNSEINAELDGSMPALVIENENCKETTENNLTTLTITRNVPEVVNGYISPNRLPEDCVNTTEIVEKILEPIQILAETKLVANTSSTDTALKENNVNSVNKNKPKISDDKPTKVKSLHETKKITKIVNNKAAILTKAKEIKVTVSKPPVINPPAITQVPPSVFRPLPTLRTTKIVKPNKVINRTVQTKRKVILIKQDQAPTPAKLMKTETSAIVNTTIVRKPKDSSRLITSMDQVKHMCNVAQLVISVQNSSNESSCEEELGDCDAMYRPLAEYNDIASPLSLNLGSPCFTPTRSNSPIDSVLYKEKTFEEKVNSLLAAKRSLLAMEEKIEVAPKTPLMIKTPKTAINVTPVAVRHLPAAAQDEYRQLIHRMKLLENQRHKKGNNCDNEENPKSNSVENKEDTDSLNQSATTLKSSLVKQVLLRNVNSKSPIINAKASSPALTEMPAKANKANVLRSYENSYVKIGAGIVNNLDKSLQLVDEAKKAKINKLKLENRLKELKAEMDLLQTKHREEDQKISRIYPTICSTNEVLTSLKQKRSKIFKAALTLGKTLKGDDYRLNNDLKQTIISKTKLLAGEIKLINSLKAPNVNKLELEMLEQERTAQKLNESISVIAKENVETKESPKKTENVEDAQKSRDEINLENVQKESVELNCNSEEGLEKNQTATNEVSEEGPTTQTGGTLEVAATNCDINGIDCETSAKLLNESETKEETKMHIVENGLNYESKTLPSYISPLEHLRNIDGTVDPNGVICPYDLMGNCEDASCKFVHISQQDKSKSNPS